MWRPLAQGPCEDGSHCIRVSKTRFASQPLIVRQTNLHLTRFIREGAESGVWGDEIAPKMIVAA
jgi:hypothetical protein